jgi:hypothetical protein
VGVWVGSGRRSGAFDYGLSDDLQVLNRTASDP